MTDYLEQKLSELHKPAEPKDVMEDPKQLEEPEQESEVVEAD